MAVAINCEHSYIGEGKMKPKIVITDNREEWREKYNFYRFINGLKGYGASIMGAAKKVEDKK